ncbi:Dabb family protein [Paenibacillus gansuensis]|uniref:Dabb family protein n=1 Tax=Paenibacillus gansuensis TaxID=306542 RepID=A0ABW5PF41_9BACL
MYEHLVTFKFLEGYKGEKDGVLLDKLLSFKESIPGIVEVTAGINVTEEVGNIHGYTLGLRVTFESKEALSEYGPHPVHQEFVSLLDGILDNVIVVDYPIVR